MIRVVRPSIQVVEFARRLAPEPRRAVKKALNDLRREQGDIRALDGKLTGFYRLRVGSHRLIFCYGPADSIDVLFIEQRSLVYEVFEAQFIKRLKG